MTQLKAQQALSSTKRTDSKVIFSAQKRAKTTMMVSEQISPCPYTVLRCFWSALAHYSPSLSLSLVWDDGQVPPRTPCLINHPYFNICKAQRLYPSLRWALLSHTRRALRDDKTHYCLSSSKEESLFSSTLFDKRRLKASFSLPAVMACSRQGSHSPSLAISFSPSSTLSHSSFNTLFPRRSLARPGSFHSHRTLRRI